MKKRFTDEQIIAMLKEQEAGEKTADLCRRDGISPGTFYKFKKVVTPDAKRQAVVYLCKAHGVSQRRACNAMQVDRSVTGFLPPPYDPVHNLRVLLF